VSGGRVIAAGIAEVCRQVDGLRVYDHLPDVVLPPLAAVGPPKVDIGEAEHPMVCRRSYQFPVLLLVARVTSSDSADDIDQLLHSLLDRLEEDTTLAGSCTTSRVNAASYLEQPVGAATYPAYTITVDAWPD
jgi:hypothetical protein